jgi:hypothetical protein
VQSAADSSACRTIHRWQEYHWDILLLHRARSTSVHNVPILLRRLDFTTTRTPVEGLMVSPFLWFKLSWELQGCLKSTSVPCHWTTFLKDLVWRTIETNFRRNVTGPRSSFTSVVVQDQLWLGGTPPGSLCVSCLLREVFSHIDLLESDAAWMNAGFLHSSPERPRWTEQDKQRKVFADSG